MKITVHHKPAASGLTWDMHVWKSAWDGNLQWDPHGTPTPDGVDFQLPDVANPRKLQFKYRSTDADGITAWEPDDFARHIFLAAPAELWTFAFSGRVLYRNPFSAGAVFRPGDTLTFHVITQNRFRGGKLYTWNPYDASGPSAYFPETSRDDGASLSTFTVSLQSWMTAGFHLKLMQPGSGGAGDIWEPDSANRVWRPCDGASLWLKSGQNDLRSEPLSLKPVGVEVLYPANLAGPPVLVLHDTVENLDFPVAAPEIHAFPGSPLFNIGAYRVNIYPGASYTLTTRNDVEHPPLIRPFPADTADMTAISRLALGTSPWLDTFPAIASATLSLQPLPVSSFAGSVSLDVSIGNSRPYQTVEARLKANGAWSADLQLAQDMKHAVRVRPKAGAEPVPYAWIDTARYFTPTAENRAFYTHEGVYGISAHSEMPFADPPDRAALMRAAFGDAIAAAGIFDAREMPHGATLLGPDVYFVVHAPHAVWAALVLVDEAAPSGPGRREIPMALTSDTFYWWCRVPSDQARSGTRYHFLLNDDLEVMDPAARAVLDRGNFAVSYGDDPAKPDTSWSLVLDVQNVRAMAQAQSWQTMGWENLLIYELHAKRFTDARPDGLMPLDMVADELNQTNRMGRPGYLRKLPATALELMPVSEFPAAASWGYNPAFFFAVDGAYGGAPALARFVNTAHESGRGVMLDLVYNHSLGSPLMAIAPDVYRNRDYFGDGMNCGHPMVGEFLCQATLYLWRTFGVDGFRFDDTKAIITGCEGGWEFLSMIHSSLRAAATAEGVRWPYCVAENGVQGWDVSDPFHGVMDGQWDIDEVYRIRDASYDTWSPGADDSNQLQAEMNSPQYWGRPFYQATRFGESHDMVSAQDPGNRRIAARPPFGQGLRMAKALGTVTLLSNGVPMLFMGQEVGSTQSFSFDNNGLVVNPQDYDLPPETATDNTHVLEWFRSLMGLRNDSTQGLQGDTNYQVVRTGNRTVAFTCGADEKLFAVVTFGTPDTRQDSAWLGLPEGAEYKEIFNSSWPGFQVESEPAQDNGGDSAHIHSGQLLNLPTIGAVVLQRA